MPRFASVQQTTVPAATAAKVRFVHPKNQSQRLSEETLAVIAGRIEEWWLGPEEAEGRTSRLMV